MKNQFSKLSTRLAGNFSTLVAQQELQYTELQLENEALMSKVKEYEQKNKELQYQIDTLRKGDSNGRHGQLDASGKQSRH